MDDVIQNSFGEALQTLQAFQASGEAMSSVGFFAQAAAQTLSQGGKLMACGNGGSMCDAMHFAEEWTGRFRSDRAPLPAMAFSDPSQLTCIANDYGYDEIFSRSVQAVGKAGDLLLAISTSGNSPNVVKAVQAARAMNIRTVGLLGRGGGELRPLVDLAVVVPYATSSDRIQEVHIKVLHIVIETVERMMFPQNYVF